MKLTTKELILCGIFAALISIMAQISIPLPFTSVPLTLLVFAVALSGLILGSKCGFISVIIYLLLGGIGLPVFAGFRGGISVLFGPTGGYLLGLPMMIWIIGYFKEKFNSPFMNIFGLLLGLLIVYITGTIMFSFITGNTILQSIALCVIPFLVTDLIKLGLAYMISSSVSKRVLTSISYSKN